MSEKKKPARSRAKRILRGLGIAALSFIGLCGIGWILIHQFPQLAGTIVDGVRSVVGPKPIAWLEDKAYALEDSYKQWRYKDAPPTEYWAPPPVTSGIAAANEAGALPPPHDDSFPPPHFSPPFANVAGAGDGVWIAIPDPHDKTGPTGIYKALVHPDPKRSFALVALVAIDLRHVDVSAVPGFGEPASHSVSREKRPGLVSPDDLPNLLAAFNGGFQAVHGQWGMMADGATLLPPRPIGCTIVRYKDSTMKVAVWKRLSDSESEMTFFRQTPPCLVEEGDINPATRAEANTGWGATVDGDTVIRRSAFGLDKTGTIAFYGMGDALSAGTLAQAMHAAGAWNVAQLDVNWSYPRFFVYDGGSPPKVAEPLAPVQNWKPDEYVGKPAFRDFFYLSRKKAVASPTPSASASAIPAPSAAPAPSKLRDPTTASRARCSSRASATR